jgi:tRNA pseudouridine55 synthase
MEIKLDQKLLLIDKPKGVTSFWVIKALRQRLGIKKIGHAGTLDPLATGLMLVGIGDGTKALHELIKLPKVYETIVIFGIRTSTGDMEGEIIEKMDIAKITNEKVNEALNSLIGKNKLKVPAYSAIKVGGRRLYKLARRGDVVDLPEKEMEVLKAELKELENKEELYLAKIIFEVSSGTYIRSLAEELGRKLGYPATIGDLRRVQIGEYKVENAISL